MKKLFATLAVVSLLTFPNMVMADEGHSNGFSIPEGFTGQTSMNNHGDSSGHGDMHNMSPEEHKNMSSGDSEVMTHEMSPEDHHNMPSETSSNGQVEQQEEEHGHGGGPVIETPPNYKALGAFGAINAGFILIGIWNKWLRRKETPTCQA